MQSSLGGILPEENGLKPARSARKSLGMKFPGGLERQIDIVDQKKQTGEARLRSSATTLQPAMALVRE